MTIDELNEICKNTFIDLLEIKFTDFDGKVISAEMPITPSKYQPAGLLHGGALLSLSETMASAGSFMMVDPGKYDVLGTGINAQHLASSREGIVMASAEIIYMGKRKHIWDVSLTSDDGTVLSICRVTNAIRERVSKGDKLE